MLKNTVFFRTVQTGMSFFRREFTIMFFLSLFNAALPIMGIYLTSNLFSTVQKMFQSRLVNWGDSSLPLYLSLYALFLLLVFTYGILYKRYYVQFYSLIKFEKRVKNMLHQKCNRISNEDFENPTIYNHVIQAQNASINIYRLIEIIISVFGGVVSTVIVSLYVSQFNPLLISFIILALLPPVIEIITDTHKQIRFLNQKTQLLKEEKVFADTITDLKMSKETTFLNLSGFFIGKWERRYHTRTNIENRMSKTLLRLRLLISPLKIIGDCAGFFLSLYLLSTGELDFGQFSASLMAYQLLKSNYVGLFSLFGYFNQFIQYVKPFFRFMDLPERLGVRDEAVSLEKGIEIKSCFFKYPTGKDFVLKNINLKIKQGETIAIVGYNGSGKTTLTNLIMGLYLPDKGSVLYNGQDISQINQDRLFVKSACVFQNFNRYYFTLGENVAINNSEGYDKGRIEQLISENFSPEEALSSDTLLGKTFGGRELSGGQWQKIAIMRAFFKDSELVVLDEPTSAIDPFSESKLYEDFRKMLQNKTGIIVTHKLGSIKLADRIIVLENGIIVQAGTHEELLSSAGLYKQLWEAQVNTYSMINV